MNVRESLPGLLIIGLGIHPMPFEVAQGMAEHTQVHPISFENRKQGDVLRAGSLIVSRRGH